MTSVVYSSGNLAELQHYLARAALGPQLPTELKEARLAIYRRLVHGALDECMHSILPRTAARLGDRFWEEVHLFYSECGPHTHYLRDVPSEFLAWCKDRWSTLEDLPAYAFDLACHEVTAIEVGAASDGSARSEEPSLSLDRPVIFQGAIALRHYQYAVHRLSEDLENLSIPEASPVFLLVYRDRNHDLRYLELSTIAFAILQRLLTGGTLQQAIVEGAASGGVPVDDTLLHGIAVLLGDLAERGVLWG